LKAGAGESNWGRQVQGTRGQGDTLARGDAKFRNPL